MTQLHAIYLEKTYPEKFLPHLANPSAMRAAFAIRAHTRSFHTLSNKRYQGWFKEYTMRIACCAEDLLGILGNARHDDALDKLDELYDLGDALGTEQEKRGIKNPLTPLDRIEDDLQVLGRKIAHAKAAEKRTTT